MTGVSPTSRINVLGVGISEINLTNAVSFLVATAQENRKGYVCVTGVHGVIESQKDDHLRSIHNESLLTVPDGMPLVWAGRQQGFKNIGRVYGPDLMLKLCAATAQPNTPFKHFLFGATPDILEKLNKHLVSQFPHLQIVGQFAPPFRALNTKEEQQLTTMVNKAKPHFFWVGLSTPKQEKFMAKYIHSLNTPVMIGVGAAFDIHAQLKKDAPTWIKNSGLQWLYRLCQEPKRLWRRYFYIVPLYLSLSALQSLGLRRYSLDRER